MSTVKLSGVASYKPWWRSMERHIRAQEPLLFMLEEKVTLEAGREAYVKKKLPPSMIIQQGGDGARVTRNSPSPSAVQQAEDTVKLVELTRLRWTVEEKFNTEVAKFSALLYETVGEELLVDGEDVKVMVDRLRKRFAQKPGSELARLQVVYRDMMREASFDNLEEWIQKWGLTMETQIREKLPHVKTNAWKLELAEKLHSLCRHYKGSHWLTLIASRIEEDAHEMDEEVTVEDVQKLVERIRKNASGHANDTPKGKGGTAFATSLDIAEDKDYAVEPSSRPETRYRSGKKRAASPNARETESQSRHRTNEPVQLCVVCGRTGHKLEECRSLFHQEILECPKLMQQTAIKFIMKDTKLKERYEAAKEKRAARGA
ncbi:hypothetical protein SEPCBS119000_006732 [Sporothrix epigloea]|uniref:CCHC-type domain-containing protein n=1 Tax=Sporothrix epigloea TaxID=1892477 RepID=A0ABP0E4K7_9PEZI